MIFQKKNKNSDESGQLPFSAPNPYQKTGAYTRHFSSISANHCDIVGHKNAALGELSINLADQGIRIPDGYAVTTKAYHDFLAHNRLRTPISQILADLPTNDISALIQAGQRIRHWINKGTFPPQLAKEITAGYAAFENTQGNNIEVAVRGSATVEGMPTTTLAGQQSSYLNIRGTRNLLKACKRVFASLFSDRALAYWVHLDLDPMEVAIAIGIQKMVRADLAVAGVMATLDTQTGFRDVITISSSYGLGVNVTDGSVTPDEFVVFKPTLEMGYAPIIRRQRGEKALKCLYGDTRLGATTMNVPVSLRDRSKFSLTDDEVSLLAVQGTAIERYCSTRDGKACPMVIEWAKDGITDELYILQINPETVQTNLRKTVYQDYQLLENGWMLTSGSSIGHKIVVAKARVIDDISQAHLLAQDEILVTDKISPEWESILTRAAAVVTNLGGRCCHSAAVVQGLGIPAVLGSGNATEVIKNGDTITLVSIERDAGYVFEGELKFKVTERPSTELPPTDTNILLGISSPETAFDYAGVPTEGVGLVRMEHLINNHIQVHPRALLEYEGQCPEVQFTIDELAAGYSSRKNYYSQHLSEGIGMIAAAFYPRPVMVRLSDFRSNEYAALYAGESFEDHEENPDLGLRGAVRYFDPKFEDSFALECEAIRYAREEMGFSNIQLVAPFVRTVDEGQRLLALMSGYGLRRAEHGLKIHLMCETPANVLLADEFLEYFDGFSIGTDDLMQLTLGIDRSSKHFSNIDERNKAVLKLVYLAIDACRRNNKYVGICGEAPSRFPEFSKWLIEQGVDSITVDPEHYFPMHKVIYHSEQKIYNSETDQFALQFKIPA